MASLLAPYLPKDLEYIVLDYLTDPKRCYYNNDLIELRALNYLTSLKENIFIDYSSLLGLIQEKNGLFIKKLINNNNFILCEGEMKIEEIIIFSLVYDIPISKYMATELKLWSVVSKKSLTCMDEKTYEEFFGEDSQIWETEEHATHIIHLHKNKKDKLVEKGLEIIKKKNNILNYSSIELIFDHFLRRGALKFVKTMMDDFGLTFDESTCYRVPNIHPTILNWYKKFIYVDDPNESDIYW